MEDEDWLKFGHALWASCPSREKTQVLLLFKSAWRRIHGDEPELENGGPPNLLYNPAFFCRNKVPWKEEVEERFALSPDHESALPPRRPAPGLAPPDPAPGPSRSHSSHPNPLKHVSSSAPTPHDSSDAKLAEKLKTISFTAIYNTAYPRIMDLFPKFTNHLRNRKKHRMTVVFLLIPQYVIPPLSRPDTDEPSAEISAVELDKSDYDAIAKHDPLCLRCAVDQTKCAENKTRYFCSSWVRTHSSLLFCVRPDLTCSPQLVLPIEMMEHKDVWDVKFLKWKVFSKAVIDQRGSTWDLLNKANLLLGGVNFTNNFL